MPSPFVPSDSTRHRRRSVHLGPVLVVERNLHMVVAKHEGAEPPLNFPLRISIVADGRAIPERTADHELDVALRYGTHMRIFVAALFPRACLEHLGSRGRFDEVLPHFARGDWRFVICEMQKATIKVAKTSKRDQVTDMNQIYWMEPERQLTMIVP